MGIVKLAIRDAPRPDAYLQKAGQIFTKPSVILHESGQHRQPWRRAVASYLADSFPPRARSALVLFHRNNQMCKHRLTTLQIDLTHRNM